MINLYAFAMHALLDCLYPLWQRCWQHFGPHERFFRMPEGSTYFMLFPDWRGLFETLLKKRPRPSGSFRRKPTHVAGQGRERAHDLRGRSCIAGPNPP